MTEENSLSEEQQKKIRAWFEEKWQGPCSVCGSTDWAIGRDTVSLQVKANQMIGGRAYVHVMCMCTNCGNTHFFNAIHMGIVEETTSREVENA